MKLDLGSSGVVQADEGAEAGVDVLSFRVAVGMQPRSAKPRGGRLPDSELVIHDRFGD